MYGLCQILLDPRGYNERVGLGFSGRGVSAQSRFPREGRELAVCQHRLSSERGRELWKDVMDRRQGKRRGSVGVGNDQVVRRWVVKGQDGKQEPRVTEQFL